MNTWYNRRLCWLFGHDLIAWYSTTYNVNHSFCDGAKCYRCKRLVFVYAPERGPYGETYYTAPEYLRQYVEAPEVYERIDAQESNP